MKFLPQLLAVCLIAPSLAFAAEPAGNKPVAKSQTQKSDKPAPKGEIVPADHPKAKGDDSGKILIKRKEPNPAIPDGAGKK